jgi:two-component system, OmpR family, phosphate regulon sensor histidine kinase PhoR
MRTIKGIVPGRSVGNRKLKTLVAQEFQTTIVGFLGHDLRQSLQVIQGTHALLRSRLEEMPQRAWLDRGERAVTKLTEQLNCLVDAFYLAERDNALEVALSDLGHCSGSFDTKTRMPLFKGASIFERSRRMPMS